MISDMELHTLSMFLNTFATIVTSSYTNIKKCNFLISLLIMWNVSILSYKRLKGKRNWFLIVGSLFFCFFFFLGKRWKTVVTWCGRGFYSINITVEHALFYVSGSNVSAYVNMVGDTLRNSIPKAVVLCQVVQAKKGLLNFFYSQLGRREV